MYIDDEHLLNSVLYLDADEPNNDGDRMDAYVQSVGIRSLHALCPDKISITLDDVCAAGKSDLVYQTLIKTVETGFPSTRSLTDSTIRCFWEVRNRLYCHDNIVYMDNRLAIPSKLQGEVLENLHSANQCVTGMRKRANQCVYWPGMSASISNFRSN